MKKINEKNQSIKLLNKRIKKPNELQNVSIPSRPAKKPG